MWPAIRSSRSPAPVRPRTRTTATCGMGIYLDDYAASAANAKDFADTGNRKREASMVRPV